MVGVRGFEPRTLRLSSACSNQLSYTPIRNVELQMSNFELRRSVSNDEPNISFVIRNSSFELKSGGAEEIRTPDL